MQLANSKKGNVWYGLHFYCGLAEYSDSGKDPYRVYLNENTLRSMDQSFTGCPVFVEHKDNISENMDQLKVEADGWVVESFYNSADGKHWVKFITTSDRADRAIKNGMKLSNAYVVTGPMKQGGFWNGIEYQNEIIQAKYDHLAIVANPRYEESVIMTPEQFKQYNSHKESELKKIANSKGVKEMKFSFFKKSKVENDLDLAALSVLLPNTKKEVTISELIENADKVVNADMEFMANGDHMVEVGDEKMKVNDLVAKYKEMKDCMKNKDAEEKNPMDMENKEDEPKDEEMKNDAEDEEAKKKALELAAHEEKEMQEEKKKNELEKKRLAKEKADAFRNADKEHDLAIQNEAKKAAAAAAVEIASDKVKRGKARYGRQ